MLAEVAPAEVKDVEVNGLGLRELLTRLRRQSMRCELLAAKRDKDVQQEIQMQGLGGGFGAEQVQALLPADSELVDAASREERRGLGLGFLCCPVLLPFAPCFVAETYYQQRLHKGCWYVVTNLGLYVLVDEANRPRRKEFAFSLCIEEGRSGFMRWSAIQKVVANDSKHCVLIVGKVFCPETDQAERVEWPWYVSDKDNCIELLRRRGVSSAPAPAAAPGRGTPLVMVRGPPRAPLPLRVFCTLERPGAAPGRAECVHMPRDASWGLLCALVSAALGVDDAAARGLFLRRRGEQLELETPAQLAEDDIIWVRAAPAAGTKAVGTA